MKIHGCEVFLLFFLNVHSVKRMPLSVSACPHDDTLPEHLPAQGRHDPLSSAQTLHHALYHRRNILQGEKFQQKDAQDFLASD